MDEKYVEIIKPDDWHVHLREKDILEHVLPFTYESFKRALVMPNLNPPINTLKKVASYYEEICASIPNEVEFDPLMTLYLSEAINAKLVRGLSDEKIVTLAPISFASLDSVAIISSASNPFFSIDTIPKALVASRIMSN